MWNCTSVMELDAETTWAALRKHISTLYDIIKPLLWIDIGSTTAVSLPQWTLVIEDCWRTSRGRIRRPRNDCLHWDSSGKKMSGGLISSFVKRVILLKSKIYFFTFAVLEWVTIALEILVQPQVSISWHREWLYWKTKIWIKPIFFHPAPKITSSTSYDFLNLSYNPVSKIHMFGDWIEEDTTFPILRIKIQS